MKNRFAFTALAVCISLLSVGNAQAKHISKSPAPTPPAAATGDKVPGTKTVQYTSRDVVKINAKVRFTTIIVLPPKERILDFIVGDREMWVVEGNQNFAYVKPAKEGTMTNLNLLTAAGNIYTFVLVEVSELRNAQPDLKVFILPKEEAMISATQAPRFVPAEELEAYRKQLELAQAETQRIKNSTDAIVEQELAKQIESLHFFYKFQPEKGPFHVSAIYTNEKFTFIEAKPDETPTLYEIKDGKPNLVNFEYKNGVFVAEKVIDRGYLAIGKEKLVFVKQEKP